jgi:amidase
MTYNQALAADKTFSNQGIDGALYGIPMGITFFGTAFSEPKLIALASGFEAVTHERAKNLPKLTPTIPDDHIAGEPLNAGNDKSQKPEGWHPHHM